MEEKTIVGIASAAGGGIGIIRVSGSESMKIVDSIFHPGKFNNEENEALIDKSYLQQQKSHTIHYGFIYDGEEVVARIDGYTFGNKLEIPTSATKEPTDTIKYTFESWDMIGMEDISKTEKNVKFKATYKEEYFVARLEETDTLEGKSYMTLQKAIDAAKEEARTVKLLRDTEESVLVDDVQNITIDLNGKTVTGSKTGIKAYMQDDEVLMLYNRSSNPKKKGLILANSVGVIDKDYYGNPDNDGHIMFAFYNIKEEDVTIKKGEAIGQGVFQKYFVTDDDVAEGERIGGFGSTSK